MTTKEDTAVVTVAVKLLPFWHHPKKKKSLTM